MTRLIRDGTKNPKAALRRRPRLMETMTRENGSDPSRIRAPPRWSSRTDPMTNRTVTQGEWSKGPPTASCSGSRSPRTARHRWWPGSSSRWTSLKREPLPVLEVAVAPLPLLVRSLGLTGSASSFANPIRLAPENRWRSRSPWRRAGVGRGRGAPSTAALRFTGEPAGGSLTYG